MQSEAIQTQSTSLAIIIRQIFQQIKIRGIKYHQQDVFIEKELIYRLQTCDLASEKLLSLIQKLIDSNKLQSPNKYIVLMYASLLGVGNNHSFALFNFYYKVASHALKEIKQIKTKNQQIWQIFFEKLYQYGMLILTGNRTLLLSMQSLGMRVNSQLFANNAREMKLNKLVRIYNCILCIPQTYMTLKQTLSLTLVFTRWSMSQNDVFTHSFFAAFEKKTQKKLIKKLSRYPKQQFIQQHILNLIKIVMCGQQMLFSYFLQAKVAYQCSKNQNIMGRQKFALQGLKGATLLKEGKRLFNLVIKLLLQAREGPLKDTKREAILVIILRFISSKFQNNEGLFNILIDNFLYEKNQIISQIAFRIIREEILSYLTVYKVKLLLNLFNISSWGLLVKNGIAEELVIERLAKINLLLMALAHRYSNSNINLKCQPQKSGLIIQNPRDVKSLTFVIVFQDVGKLTQPDSLNGILLKLKLDGSIYQLKICFTQTSDSLSIQYKSQKKQRQGEIQLMNGKKQLLHQAKQFIRYKDGSYITLVTASLSGKEGRKLNLSVDGSYYEFQVNKKSEIKSIQIGRIKGIIQSFYALNIEISPVQFYKQWSELQMKTNYLIESLGKEKICYRLTNRLQTPIQASVEKGWSLFKAKTQISFIQVIKSPILLDIFLQLGGLQTMFFILERLSRTLLQFKGKEKKIVELLGQFFQMIKLTASVDQSYSFIAQIVKCFKYINPFMFLLIKRNKIFKQTHDSSLLLNIFEMIMYFRKGKPLSTTPNQIIKKMKQIQIKFLVQTLCNFQIWSGCSFPLQQFVLSLIENYIKNEKKLRQLIQINLYKQLLGTLVLFATSQTHLQHSQSLQNKVIKVCDQLYRQIQNDFTSMQSIKQIQLGKDKQIFDNFIERDLFMSLSLLKALASKGFYRKLSESQKSAFLIILNHIIKTFIQTSFFKIIAKNWSLYLSFLFNICQKMIWIDRQLLNSLIDTIMVFVSKQISIDGCITNLFRSFIENKATSFVDCLYFLHIIAEKYNYISPGKQLIFQTLIQYLQSKITSVVNKQIIEVAKQMQLFSESISIRGLFRLSQKKQFFQFYKKMKQICFNLSQSHIYWRKYNYNSLVLLYQQNKITQKNSNFIKYLIQNIYFQDPDHPLASNSRFNKIIKINQIKELAESQRKNENKMKIDTKGVCSLIDHCRGWLTLYFLYDHGALNGTSDLCVPFLASQITNQIPPGGIIPYYLSGKCQLHELYLLLNIIVYRQLGNRISYLTTLVPVVIYQQTVERLIQEIIESRNDFFIPMVIILLKEVHNSLNNGYIIKTGTVCKDLQRLLGSVHQDGYRKKQGEAADALARASTRIQLALQESKVDKQLAFLLELQINVVKKIQQDQNPEVSKKMLKLLVEQIKRIPQSVFRRLNMVGLRFFQVSKEHWLYNKQTLEPIEPKSQKMTEVVLYYNTNFQKLLQQNYQKLLSEYNVKGMQSEKNWQNLLISNTYWFQHQGDLGDLSTKFYQLDEKEIGPFGFYKLGIKPVRTDLQKLPFPRRQQYKDLIIKKEQQSKLRDIAPRQTILNSKSTFFTQASRPQSLVRSTTTESIIVEKQKKLNKEYWCQWVTKRGVYAGSLCKRDKKIQFIFIGHSKLPEEIEYQMSTNKCHRIEQLSEWELKQFGNVQIPYLGSQIFTRRYILRHTAFQIFIPNIHRSYFFNLFFQKQLHSFLSQFKNGEVDLIINRPDAFSKRGFTEKWLKGQISNFEYLYLVNRYSGRTTNDLAQYPVFPWVLVNFNGQDGFTQINQKFLNQPNNMRDLTKPTGKLGEQKFRKLKSRLEQIDPADKEIRFLYGTMFSNPTVLYNFFIRLQPFTSLHWAHQSGKLDHADRLFSGLYDQFITIITSSSDMKELCPQFYYWPEFLRNRNRIQLGRKQKGDEVDAVQLPVWAKNPQEFIFKMREVLESPQVSKSLHHWIDLIFGEKAPYQKAEQNDNLYHYQCYQQDIFTRYESEAEMRTAQIAISEFGQVPQQIFDKPHPSRIPRKQIYLDTVITISKSQQKSLIKGYQYNQVGIMFNTQNEIIFKKTAINGFYNNFQWTRDYQTTANSLYLDSIYNSRWIALLQGNVRLYQRKKLKAQYQIQSRCLECMGDYLFFGIGTKIAILKIVNENFQEMTQLFGHHSQVILIRTQAVLDLLISVDQSGLVLIHELVQLRFLRAFHLGTEFDNESALKLHCCIHKMGYFIFFDHQQTLYVYNYLGEQLLEQQMLIKTEQKTQKSEKQDLDYQQIITGIQIFSHDAPIILTSTSRGNIYAFNFFQIMRFKVIYPYKNYGREIKNLLSAVPRRKNNSIIQFSMIRSLGTSNTIYQIIVLYDDGQLVCFSQNVQMTKQLSSNIRLKTMGIV